MNRKRIEVVEKEGLDLFEVLIIVFIRCYVLEKRKPEVLHEIS